MRKSGHARSGRRASRYKVPVRLKLGRKAGAGGEVRGHSTESPAVARVDSLHVLKGTEFGVNYGDFSSADFSERPDRCFVIVSPCQLQMEVRSRVD